MNLFLIGFRGSGKSVVGRALAERLNHGADRRSDDATAPRWAWVDTDACVEQRAGRSIADIFSLFGEAEFRRLEAAILDELVGRTHQVVSAGGGMVLSAENRARFRRAGKTVWLRLAEETARRRLAADQSHGVVRPPLTNLSLEREVAQLMAVRQPLYAECADYIVDVDDRTVDQIVDAISRWWAEVDN
jgi:shikimate kinase